MSVRQPSAEGGALPARLTLNGRVLDRRSFLGARSLAGAGTVLTTRGWTAAVGAQGGMSLSHAGGSVVGGWHVDDMWGHMPRYAHPIACSPVHQPIDLDNVDAVDRAFVT
jgi:hypothetical protein